MSGKDWRKRNALIRWRKSDREADAWISDGNEFQTSDAATGNARRPTVVSRIDGMSSWCDDLAEVGDDWAGRRHEPADSGMVARDHVAPETPWQPPWIQHVVVDAASAELRYLLLAIFSLNNCRFPPLSCTRRLSSLMFGHMADWREPNTLWTQTGAIEKILWATALYLAQNNTDLIAFDMGLV